MKYFYYLACLLIVGGVHFFPARASAEQANIPIATQKALTALMASSNMPIPESSTCHGHYGQTGKATIKDVLATQLAGLYAGTNVITGDCIGAACTVTIRHAVGEDLSSATFKFRIRKGNADPATLSCLITP